MAKKINAQPDDLLPVVQKEVSPVVSEAMNYAIRTQEDYSGAMSNLQLVKQLFKRVDAEKSRMLIPLKQAVKVEQDRWKPIETELSKAEGLYKEKMALFVEKDRERQKAEEEKVLKKNYKNEETTLRKIAEVQESVSQGVRTIKELVIEDTTKIPREYLAPVESLIREALKNGKNIPGCYLRDKIIIASR
jgi:hypothetical protein